MSDTEDERPDDDHEVVLYCRLCEDWHEPPSCEDVEAEMEWDAADGPYVGSATYALGEVQREQRPLLPQWQHLLDSDGETFGTFTDYQWAVTKWADPKYL